MLGNKISTILPALILCSCHGIRDLNKSYDLEDPASPLLPLLIDESNLNLADNYSLIGSIHQRKSAAEKENLIETAYFLASGNHEHKNEKMFLTIRHDLWLYESLPAEDLPSSFRYLQQDEFQIIQLTDIEAKCSSVQNFGRAMQCETSFTYGDLYSVLNITFPVDTSPENIKEIMGPIAVHIESKIADTFE